ncbi:MAG: GIY-YIG nuclease family protein, partial [Sphingomonas sp.]|nr:GIY-YIG nuclease family protein [Sphingomonas sp.]
DWIKIGVAANIESRMGGMRVNCPYPLTLVGSRRVPKAADALRVEAAVHRKLAAQLHVGEWFRDEPIDPVAALDAAHREAGFDPVDAAIDPRKPFSVFDPTPA